MYAHFIGGNIEVIMSVLEPGKGLTLGCLAPEPKLWFLGEVLSYSLPLLYMTHIHYLLYPLESSHELNLYTFHWNITKFTFEIFYLLWKLSFQVC